MSSSEPPHLGDLSPAGSVAVGIVVGLVSTSIQSVGLTLQRKSHLLEDEKFDEMVRRPAYRRRRWQLGMLMFVIANLVGSTIQITTLPLPVLSTLQASGLVFNTICASLILHEPFTRWSFIGTALVAGGAVLIAMFGSVAEPSHSLSQHLELLARRQFILWMVGTFIIMAFILTTVFFINRIYPKPQPPILRLLRGFAFGSCSSILSAHALLVAKSAVELIVRTISDRNQFNRWESWVILLLLIFFALSQLYFLHRGLKIVSTSVLYPFVFCIYNITAILDGLIYFKQVSRLSALHSGLIAVGTFVLLSGVFSLSWRPGEDEHSAPPPDAHSFLTPGMGIVEDTTTEDEADDSDIDDDNASITSADDELNQALSPTSQSTEQTPLLRTPTARHNAILQVTKKRRKRAMTLTPAEEIRGELWDEAPQPPSPQQSRRRRSSSEWGVSPVSFRPRRASTLGHTLNRSEENNNAIEDGEPSQVNGSKAKVLRARTMHTGTALGGVGAGPGARARLPSLTWRERDRERRRSRAWSSRQRSGSMPLSMRSRDSGRASTTDRVDAGSGRGIFGRRESLADWLTGWWTGQRDRGEEDEGDVEEGNNAGPRDEQR